MKKDYYDYQTLNILENNGKKMSIEYDSSLVRNVVAAYDKQIKDLTDADLRVLVGQKMGLEFIIHRVIKRFKVNLFADCDLYEGVLLKNVLEIPDIFWQKNKNEYLEILQIINLQPQEQFEELIQVIGKKVLEKKLSSFKSVQF